MPIYEYKCRDCGTEIEKRQSVSEEALTVCENCGGKLEKQWSLSGIKFKGEGWYINDYAAKKPDTTSSVKKGEKVSSTESTAKADTASNTSSDSSTSTKTDTAAKKD